MSNILSVKIQKNYTQFILLISLFFTSCEYFSVKEENKEMPKPIARVYDKYLYPSDIEGVVPKRIAIEDSTAILQRYIKSWIEKQLLISEAASKIKFDQAEIERKILDYRYALMVYEFEKDYIAETLDTTVSNEEISDYYKENIQNFELKQNIVKGQFIKLPIDAPKQKKLKKLLREDDEKSKKELKSYCYRFATSYFLEDSIWINFDDLIKNSPLINIPNKIHFLQQNKFYETQDDNFIYLVKIKNYKISDETSPLQFVNNQIKTIIINKRKVTLTQELHKKILNKAKENNNYEVFIDK